WKSQTSGRHYRLTPVLNSRNATDLGRNHMSVSVAVCTYNGEEHLEGQIDSIIEQTHMPDQIIFCDDGSTDETLDILNNYRSEYPHIIELYKNSSNLGITKNFSKAISKCNGDYIFLSDQDDVWKEDKIKKHIKCHEESNAGVVFNNALVVNHRLEPITDHWSTSEYQSGIAQNPRHCFSELLKYNFMKGCEMSFSDRVKEYIVPIPDNVPHDYYIAISGSVVSYVSSIEEPLHLYRRHSANESDWETNKLKKNIASALEKRELSRVKKDVIKWGEFLNQISTIPSDEMLLDKQIVCQHLNDRYQFEKNRYEIYNPEQSLLSRHKYIIDNIYGGGYKRFSVKKPSLYLIKDFLRATLSSFQSSY
ncbi:glycosyltransferase, partial [Saliphagus infecundisoli]